MRVFRAALILLGLAACGFAQCTSTLSPPSANVSSGGGTGTFNVTTSAPDCPKTAVAGAPWISVTFVTGTGPTSYTVGYAVPANPELTLRTGSIAAGNQSFTITQAGASCSFSLSSGSATVSANGGNGSFSVIATAGCSWTAVTSAQWVTINSGSGTGSGSVSYSVASNLSPNARTGAITVGTQTFTVVQSGFTCNYTISPSSASIAGSGASGSFNLTVQSGCSWTALSNAPWLGAAPESGSGPATINYTAAANADPAPRTATITVGTQTFTVTQSAACALTLFPGGVTVAVAGGTGSVTVTANASSCDRSAVSSVSWITITSGSSGSGSGSFGYSVAANTTGQPRTGTVTVGGIQTFTVMQDAGICTITVSPSSPMVPASGGSGSLTLTVSGSCGWTVISNNDWITVISGASDAGNGTVRYSVAANTSSAPRIGSLNIAGQTFNISQSGVPCTVSLGAFSASVAVGGGAGSIEVGAGPECSWTATSSAAWISISFGSPGAGNGIVGYTVAANTAGQPRSGTIAIANQLFTITQPAAACEVALSPTSASLPSSGGSGSIGVTSNCSWTAATSARWLELTGASGSGGGSVGYTAAENPAAEARTGVITIGGQTFTVTQAGVSCNVALTPPSAEVAGSGGSGTVNVTSGSGCKWTVHSLDDWIQITAWSNISGSGVVYYAATANPSRTPRSGSLSVGGQTFALTQGPAEVVISSARVVNAASLASGAVAPGEIVTFFGTGIGPAVAAPLQLTADGGFLTTALAGTQVFFDDVPAPLTYVSDTQVNAIVPYAVAGKTSTQLQVDYQGVRSKAVTLKVAEAAPALFTQNASGSGPGAILNQDYKLNTASNPAVKGSVVMLFATGEGQTNPAGMDGKIAAQPLPTPKLAVTALIGGVSAPVLYAGAAPGLVAGLVQVNVRVPSNVTSGNAVPVLLRVGSLESPAGVTMAVR